MLLLRIVLVVHIGFWWKKLFKAWLLKAFLFLSTHFLFSQLKFCRSNSEQNETWCFSFIWLYLGRVAYSNLTYLLPREICGAFSLWKRAEWTLWSRKVVSGFALKVKDFCHIKEKKSVDAIVQFLRKQEQKLSIHRVSLMLSSGTKPGDAQYEHTFPVFLVIISWTKSKQDLIYIKVWVRIRRVKARL